MRKLIFILLAFALVGCGPKPGDKISAFSSHTCIIIDTGAIKCWGTNEHGQLGDGGTANHAVPVNVVALNGRAVALAAGGQHTCALLDNSQVQCWGSNEFGQLGNGANKNSSKPVTVSDLGSDVAEIMAVGYYQTCALTQSGIFKCWGKNDQQQFGKDTKPALAPQEIKTLHAVTDMVIGAAHTCVLDGGKVKCWGMDAAGQLGNGHGRDPDTISPVDVITLDEKISSIAGSGFYTCALNTANILKCWGWNEYGQLGNGNKQDQYSPIGISNDIASISPSDIRNCAILKKSGGIKCWGNNFEGKLGDGTTIDSSFPVDVVGLNSDALEIANGSYHTCVLMKNGNVKCWGTNERGQLGNGSLISSTAPVDVIGFGPASAVTKVDFASTPNLAVTVTAEFYATWMAQYSITQTAQPATTPPPVH